MNKQREHAIRVVISINGAKCTTTLGFSVDKEVWQRGDLSAYQNSRGVSGADIQRQMKRLQDGMKAWEERLYGRRPSTQEIRTRMRRILFNEEETAVQRYKPKFKLVPKPVIYLAKQELLTLYYYRVPCNGTKVKLADATGKHYDKVVRHASTLEKTRDRLPIEISTKAREILDKYALADLPDERVLPALSCQKMNKYLKELCELCGIKSPIAKVLYRNGVRHETVYPKYALVGTHAARRTFICFALSQGIPPQVVMKWTGHADYQSMRPYIDVASGVTAAAMRKLSAAWK